MNKQAEKVVKGILYVLLAISVTVFVAAFLWSCCKDIIRQHSAGSVRYTPTGDPEHGLPNEVYGTHGDNDTEPCLPEITMDLPDVMLHE